MNNAFVALFSLFFTLGLHAQVPNTLHHQGRIAVDGVNFDGTGEFRFLLYHGTSLGTITTPLWKNDDSSPANGDEPATSISTVVTKGLYSLDLGASPQQAITADLTPAPATELYLRIWFDDGTNGSQQLSPDKLISSTPFALNAQSAETALTVPDNSITEDSLSFDIGTPFATSPLVLAGKTTTRDLGNGFAGGFIQFPKNFPSVPACVAGVDETLSDNGPTFLRQEKPARVNEIAFRAGTLCDRIHWFAIEPGVHTISSKSIMAGNFSGINSVPRTITFPQSFPSPPVVIIMNSNPNSFGGTTSQLTAVTNNGFTVRTNSPIASDLSWIALQEGQYEHGRFKWFASSEVVSSFTPILTFPLGFNSSGENPGLISSVLELGNVPTFSTRLITLTPQSATLAFDTAASDFIHYLAFLEDQ